jgi:hypothetical protein
MANKLEDLRISPNAAEMLSEKELGNIANLVREGFEEDKESRAEWEATVKEALEIAKLVEEKKNTPFVNAANIKFPLLTTANIQFAARTYPEIIRNGKVVEVAVIGKDADGQKEQRAKRVAEHMSYQLLIESNDWEEHTDRALHLLPTTGIVFKKTWFDPIEGKNRSILCQHDEVIVNDNIRSLEEARRISHVMYFSRNQIVEQVRSGLFSKDVLEKIGEKDIDQNKEYEVIEQHRYLDLDEDGYEEPYVVTVLRELNLVLRIVARFDGNPVDEQGNEVEENIIRNEDEEIVKIKPNQFFTDFHFIPNPEGTFHSIGFGMLLLPLNRSVNTILNQLIDAGKLANTQGGFINKAVKMKDQDMKLEPGEWKKVNVGGDVNLAQNIVPISYKEPSNVLFSLLGLLIDSTKELSSVTDALTGTQPGQNVPATTMLALVEQGLKVFGSIQRRLYRSFKKEYEKLYKLNKVFLDAETYSRVMDDPNAVFAQDYEDRSLDIRPVSDPNISSDAQRLARTKAILDLLPTGTVNPTEAVTRYLTDLDVPNIEPLVAQPQEGPSPEELELQAEMAKEAESIRLREMDLKVRAAEAQARVVKMEADTQKSRAQAIESIAKAEAQEVGTQLQEYKLQLEALKLSFDQVNQQFAKLEKDKEAANGRQNVPGSSPGVDTPPDNPDIL